MKYCTKCQKTKHLTDYYQYHKKDRPNIQIFSYCKICTNETSRNKKQKKEYTNICEYCGNSFETKHFDTRFCCSYHSLAIRLDPKRKRLNKKKTKEENEKHIYNLDLTAQEVHELTGIDRNYIYTLRRIASKENGEYKFKLANKPIKAKTQKIKLKAERKVKVPKNKFKYEDNFKVKKESKESRIEKWNKIFKDIQC